MLTNDGVSKDFRPYRAAPLVRGMKGDHMSREGRKADEKAHGDTAAELMTVPAITITPAATTVEAARHMEEHGVKRLPVVDEDGTLLGIVSRYDLLKVFVRQDGDIAHEVREEVLDRSLWADADNVYIRVDRGVVTLSGSVRRRSDAEIAARMIQRVNGVVDVIDKLEWKEDDTPRWG